MIFINNILNAIGESSLIIQIQAYEFYNHNKTEDNDFDYLFDILCSNNISDLKESKKNNLLLATMYFVSERKDNAKNLYFNKFKGKINELNEKGSPTDLLHLIFNLIEMELKYQTNFENLKQLHNKLNILENLSKSVEDNLLFKYYKGLLQYMRKEYNESNIYVSEIILDINDKPTFIKNNDLINFIEVKNSLLRIKILENDNFNENKKDIISHLECLFEANKGQKEDFAINLAIKMNALQVRTVDCQNCIKTLEELLKILHKEMLFGKMHKNIISELLYVNGLLGYYNSLIKNNGEVRRFANKIKKNLNSLQLFKKDKKFLQENNPNNLTQYEFIYLVLLNTSNTEKNNEKTNEKINMNLFNILLSDKSKLNDEIILNISILNKNDNNIKELFVNKEEKYINLIKTSKNISDKDLLTCYLYFYNGISNLTENILNAKMNKEINKKIRDYCNFVIAFTKDYITRNNYIKRLFQLNYFKDLFNKIYFAYLYSFYYEKEYQKCLKEFKEYDEIVKIQFELAGETKSYLNILKIQGDCNFKLGSYNEAIIAYNNILGNAVDENLNSVIFNLAICYAFTSKINESINHFKKLLENPIDNEMRNIIEKIMNKFPK
jgi:hypothetical protein